MAQIKNSPFEGMRGTLGDLVFRTWNGKTHVYAKSTKPRPQSEAQKKNRDKFREASFKAKQLLSDATGSQAQAVAECLYRCLARVVG